MKYLTARRAHTFGAAMRLIVGRGGERKKAGETLEVGAADRAHFGQGLGYVALLLGRMR
ncbi:MAG: hypothetical protein O7D34_09335 [Ignavibacteria bacterium]|nr:hypothetical protein [Ignavibacteria bacterium]